MEHRTVILALPAVGDVVCRVLDSSDGMERANVHLQEVLLWSTYIQRFHELYFPRPESREETLEMAAIMAMPTLIGLGIDADLAEEIGLALADDVLDKLLPGDIGEARQPGATTFERLAQAMEYRRQALRKLFAAVVQTPDPNQLDAMVDASRDWDVAMRILDALMTGEDPEDEDTDSPSGDGADRRPAATPGDHACPADPAGGREPGDQDRGLSPADPRGSLDHGGDAGTPGGATDERAAAPAADSIRPSDAPQPGGTEELAGHRPQNP